MELAVIVYTRREVCEYLRSVMITKIEVVHDNRYTYYQLLIYRCIQCTLFL